MDKLTLALIAAIAAPGAAGGAYLARVLRRDRGMIWRPGDTPPDVPPDSPIRTWTERAPR